MKAFFIVTALVALSSSAFALIGENQQQIENRYGKPIVVSNNPGNYHQVTYFYRGFMVLVDFVDGISWVEMFVLPEKGSLTEDDIKRILLFSCEKDVTWRNLPPLRNGDRCWRRSDGRALAHCPTQANFVSVQDVHSFVAPK